MDTILLNRIAAGVRVSDFEHAAWERAPVVRLVRYYNGALAAPHRTAEARLLWTPAALCVRFVCAQGEPLVVTATPQTARKTIGLWEQDVCEMFVAPDARKPERYFEFEVAPTGEWLDLAISLKPEGRATDWEYSSGMEAAGRIEENKITVAMRVPWSAFGGEPQAGDVWRINLFRCVGRDTQQEARGYLAWQPTRTAQPNFHVPAAFGRLEFGSDE